MGEGQGLPTGHLKDPLHFCCLNPGQAWLLGPQAFADILLRAVCYYSALWSSSTTGANLPIFVAKKRGNAKRKTKKAGANNSFKKWLCLTRHNIEGTNIEVY